MGRAILISLAGLGATWLGVRLSEHAELGVTQEQSPTVAVIDERIHLEGGHLSIAPNDWEALGKINPVDVEVAPFSIDSHEVTVEAWSHCDHCAKAPAESSSPRQAPIAKVRPEEAEAFCQTRGGRLPTHNEWMWAASSGQGNRYPWGQTGLVCRKAVFGTVEGPCANGVARPAPVGSRLPGATPTGIYDLCGNVAEWVKHGSETYAVGGSFRSTLAGQLKAWSYEQTRAPRDDIGFRCAYDRH